jgi:DNA sulfur modification protein DndE
VSPIERIKLSQQAREQLSRLKRYTGVEHWNTLCRWGFCRSLADPDPPPPAKIPADSNVELSWSVFGGRYERVYLALLKERCLRDGLGADDETLINQFRLHLHRGIAQLIGDRTRRDLASFLTLAMPMQPDSENDSVIAAAD